MFNGGKFNSSSSMFEPTPEDIEFDTLVDELKQYNFTTSGQVSRYILDNNLGRKYPNISGIVRMEKGVEAWDFNGGFPPDIYAKLCKELGLRNKRSGAKPVGFKAYKNIMR